MKNNMQLSEKDILKIGLSHCYFLKGSEKLFLLDQFKNLDSFVCTSLKDISILIKRRIHPKGWGYDIIKKLVERSIKYMDAYDIHIVDFNDKEFPAQLREIPSPPLAIFYRGKLPDFYKPMLAMVGTRKPTGEGIASALKFSKDCTEHNIPVISGLALGIDTFSHRGCLESEGLTIAVLACGVEQIYPRRNKSLAVKILEMNGCILTEYPPGTEPLPYRFPERNRIISGLSRGVIVVEAPKKSGALLTADFALEQGRDVFVLKEILDSLQNEGGKKLHDDGAIAIESIEDVINEWENIHTTLVDKQNLLFN